ncbi:MAG: polyprenyl diphosphate synthase [Rickettsiales bacterium]|nr:polyprenyl diphosphate synthase [Rickettsiales bacterium]
MPETIPETTSGRNVPNHIAIIMDGNGRWAKERGLPRKLGHKRGAEALKALLTEGKKLGIRYLTVYAFSAENWGRPQEEVSALMGLLGHYLDKEAELLIKNQIRFRTIGDISTLEPTLRKRIEALQEKTAQFDQLHLTVALSYGARQEITNVVKQLVSDGVEAESITDEAIAERLDTVDLPELDLLIRTGGDQRLSNFLLWQSAYTELYFTPTYWPDFNAEHLSQAIESFDLRERRYGNV